MNDQDYMKLALSLAEKGRGFVGPNPMVGAVIVKDGNIIGQGYHQKFGGAHAERNALASCALSPVGATMYVTLEPCCHWGKTPPCTDAILDSGIARVVVGAGDPNPLVAGKGAGLLRNHGVDVVEGVLGRECGQLNEVFFHFIRTGTPFVVLKYAMTADGKIATRTGASQWITGEAARRRVHEDRLRYSAVMTGVGTVLADDPLLTCRIPGGRNPVRVVCDTRLRTPLSSRLVRTAREVPTVIAACRDAPVLTGPYLEAGCTVLTVPEKDGHADLAVLMKLLGQRQIDSVLLEGGAELNFSALASGIVNRVHSYIAPKLFGGVTAKTPVGGEGVDAPDRAFRLGKPRITQIEEDILLEWEVEGHVHGDH